MTLEKPDSSTAIYDQFTQLTQHSEELLSDGLSVKDSSKQCSELIKRLECMLNTMNKLDLYSDNEHLDDISTKDLRMLKVYAYLGLLLTSATLDNRLDCLERAIFYMRRYLVILKTFDIFNDPDTEALLVDCPTGKGSMQQLPKDLAETMKERERRVKRFKDQSMLKSRLEKANIGDPTRYSEEDVREIYLDELRLYGLRVLEEIALAIQEYDLLKSRQRMTDDADGVDGVSTPQRPCPFKLFVIPHEEEKKKDWLQRRDLTQHTAAGAASNSVVAEFSPRGSRKTVTFDEELASSSSSDSGDDTSLRRQREWDDYKDSHPRGWGNTHNKG
uniref:TAP42-like protein n=1 Tax=Trichuris muris TaxID=70415 RepID=A0A5S6Q6P6_TRIMR